MRTRFLTLDRLDQRDERAWRGLAERSADANPFFEPEFILPAARHLGLRGTGLLVAEEGTDWVACLPVSQRATKLQVPVLAGWRTPYSFLGTPLVAEGAERVLPHLVSEVQRGRLSGVTMLDQISRESAAWQAIEDGVGRGELVALARRDFDRAAFAPEGPNPELPLSSRRRADLRRTRRRIEELLGGEVELVQLDAANGAVDEFLALEGSGWKGNAGTALSASESHARFFADLCRGFASQGRLEMTALRCAGRTLAMVTLLAARNSRYAFKMAFDEEFRKQAPGAQLIVEFTEHPRDGRAHYMDSCADPDNEIMNRLWPDRRSLVSVALARPGVRAGMMKRALRIAGAAPAMEVATR